MKDIKRIMPDEALAAYLKIGAKPVTGIFCGQPGSRTDCGCVAGVYAMAVLGHPTHERKMFCVTLEEAGFDHRYLVGLYHGFDGRLDASGGDKVYALGYADGLAAWAAVKHLAD